jgi:hypothetical protein
MLSHMGFLLMHFGYQGLDSNTAIQECHPHAATEGIK